MELSSHDRMQLIADYKRHTRALSATEELIMSTKLNERKLTALVEARLIHMSEINRIYCTLREDVNNV